ncbi:MAG: histidine--tRNA ligase [Butyrivibrio sp.]|nr:histidine--tRNA ligase [Butyrivibrio sp.]
MADLVKKPVTGMRDILPSEMTIRNYCMNVIRGTYESYGFVNIETPVVESLANLTSKQGGDNEKLMFRILKRGEKLRIDEAKNEDDLSDAGLRYDLTVPLSRYYAAHQAELMNPFKAIQIGSSFRAERPQKGRFRQFTQCDIDIFGEPSNLAEIELILATSQALTNLGFSGFQVRVNDRRLLRAMADYSGFPADSFDQVCISLDKLDKIGRDGVEGELSGQGLPAASIDRYLGLFDVMEMTEGYGDKPAAQVLEQFAARLGDALPHLVLENLTEILTTVEEAKGDAGFQLVFDPTLVRGMGYYTGTIYEIAMPQFGGACGGGGRYDGMVGRFTGTDVPACGFSIGFERIIMLLMEQGFTIPDAPARTAFLIEKGVAGTRLSEILKEADALRREGRQVLTIRRMKNTKFQKQQLAERGFEDIREFFRDAEHDA